MTLPLRPRVLVLGILAISLFIGIFFGIPLLDPKHGAERTVNKLLDAFEVADNDTVARLIADDYSDPWNFTHEEIVEFARLLRRPLYACTVSRNQNSAELSEEKDTATIVSTLHLRGKGRGIANQIVEGSSAVTFTLRRVSDKPWDWKIIRIETPHSGKARGYKARLKKLVAELDNYLPQ